MRGACVSACVKATLASLLPAPTPSCLRALTSTAASTTACPSCRYGSETSCCARWVRRRVVARCTAARGACTAARGAVYGGAWGGVAHGTVHDGRRYRSSAPFRLLNVPDMIPQGPTRCRTRTHNTECTRERIHNTKFTLCTYSSKCSFSTECTRVRTHVRYAGGQRPGRRRGRRRAG